MLAAAIRDLVWRRRRFSIALAATALVMSMSLVMSGLSASFPVEIDRLLDALGGERYLAAEGASGPVYPGTVVAAESGPDGSAGVLFGATAVPTPDGVRQVAVFGVVPGELGDPGADEGQPLSAPGGVVVSTELGADVGDQIELAGSTFAITGLTKKITLFGGQPVLFMPLADAQRLFAGGQPIATFLLAPPGSDAPVGLTAFDRDDASDDFIRPLGNATDSITFVTVLLWIVAACIVGSVVFLSALERTRDFAVFKATGASTSSIAAGLVVQSVILAAAASALAIVFAALLAPRFPMPVEIPTSAMLRLPVLAMAVGLLASLVGLRRVLSVPPSLAFGGAS